MVQGIPAHRLAHKRERPNIRKGTQSDIRSAYNDAHNTHNGGHSDANIELEEYYFGP